MYKPKAEIRIREQKRKGRKRLCTKAGHHVSISNIIKFIHVRDLRGSVAS